MPLLGVNNIISLYRRRRRSINEFVSSKTITLIPTIIYISTWLQAQSILIDRCILTDLKCYHPVLESHRSHLNNNWAIKNHTLNIYDDQLLRLVVVVPLWPQ